MIFCVTTACRAGVQTVLIPLPPLPDRALLGGMGSSSLPRALQHRWQACLSVSCMCVSVWTRLSIAWHGMSIYFQTAASKEQNMRLEEKRTLIIYCLETLLIKLLVTLTFESAGKIIKATLTCFCTCFKIMHHGTTRGLSTCEFRNRKWW